MRRSVAPLVPEPSQRVVIDNPSRAGTRSAVICSLAVGRHRELLAETAPTMLAYARRHGWSVVLTSENLVPERPAAWAKIKLIQELMLRYEFVFWVAADAIIVDLDRDVLAEIDSDADAWFARHPQEHNPEATVLNSGVFLVRSSPFATDLLDAMWNSEQFIEHNWWENAALLDLLGYSLESPFPQLRVTKWQQRIGHLDLAWNSVPGYCESPHPAINHHARSDHDDFGRRLEEMADDRRKTMAAFPSDFPSANPVSARLRRLFERRASGGAPA